MSFHIGQKVVCVRRFQDEAGYPHITFPRLGSIYTVRNIVQGFDGVTFRLGIVLGEIKNGIGPFGNEYCFVPERFRPLDERKTDISIFTQILNDARSKEPALTAPK